MRIRSYTLGIIAAVFALPLAFVLAPLVAPAIYGIARIVRGFQAFTRTSHPRSFILASWHSPHSITWRWWVGIEFSGRFFRPNSWLPAFSFYLERTKARVQCVAVMPWLELRFFQQQPMWYRDSYNRAQGELDLLRHKYAAMSEDFDALKHAAARAIAAPAGGPAIYAN